ncbi:S8 family serine peptidase [Tessaracoccus flavus]|uniref:Uncharacterized protein n=1 Tax=Tessaracoccus flavus TaxID=1610493 RepID=A0A1Q2CEY7_9ACTN|nr:S8 family serine peptidase [Tessaracoccus flavus]AQP44673.1 hypothetical protein RPIT_07505 [Tessaracoccus flavus]SDZ21832.1 von Willebrand factor type A domain-containing protein [Tessaracoccus flavus]
MNRHYYRKDQAVEVEEVDAVVAVHTDTQADEKSRFRRAETEDRAAIRKAAPQLDDDALDAFERAGWLVVKQNARARRAVREGTVPDGADAAGTVLVHDDGRVVIATDVLTVQLNPGMGRAEVEAELDAAGLTVLNELRFAPNLFEVRTAQGNALDASVALHENQAFVFAEPSFIEHVPQRFTPADTEYADQWQWSNTGQAGGTAGADVSAEAAWDHTRGAGIRVAVIDNGFDADHEDLAAGVGAGSGFFTGGSPAGFTVGTAGMPDENHGTFCAGMVGAREGNARGGVGAAPESELMLLACLNDQVGSQTTLARAVAYAADPSTEVAGADPATGADIIVSSLGPNGAAWTLMTVLDLALQAAATNGRGGLGTAIFWAASNGNNVDVALDQVVSHADVIAVVRSDRNDMEDNAARGAGVELIAPGVDVVNAFSGNTYGPWTGTSFAAPCTAGCAALALSVDPGMTRDQLRQLMRDTADQIGGVVYDAAGHNDDYGFGRVNAFAAVAGAARHLQLLTPNVVFNDVPEGDTVARAVVWEVSGVEDFTFEVFSGPSTITGPAGSFSLLLGPTVTVPAPGVGVTSHARIWVTYTGTNAGDTATGELVARSLLTGQQWTIGLSANTIERPTAGVVMVMDKSGSMDAGAGDGRTRVEVLRESASVLVDLLRPETGIGVVRFDHDSDVVMNVTDAGPEAFGAGRAQAIAAVAGHVANPGGATSIGDGVAAAGTLLDAVSGVYEKTAMIVLTDGQENAPALISDVAGSIDDTVFAIGLGEPSAINPAKLTELTNGTGGYVNMTGVLSSDERFLLSKYYLQILAGVSNEQIVLDPQGWIQPGDPVKVPFQISRADSATDVILLAPAPWVVNFQLVAPGGETITPATSGVSYVTGASVAYYRLSLPHVGAGGDEHWGGEWTALLEVDKDQFYRWLAKLEGSDPKAYEMANAHGLQYALEVHSRSSLTLNAALHQEHIQPGSVLHLVARLSEYGIPVDDDRARVHAELTGPSGYDEVKLHQTAPGVFEADYKAADYGVYRFRVVAQGRTLHRERFTREQLVSGSIYAPRPPEGDPRPPKDEDTNTCTERIRILVSVLGKDPALVKRLEELLRRQGTTLTAVLECLQKMAGSTRPVPVRPTIPEFPRPIDVFRPPVLDPFRAEATDIAEVPLTAAALAEGLRRFADGLSPE